LPGACSVLSTMLGRGELLKKISPCLPLQQMAPISAHLALPTRRRLASHWPAWQAWAQAVPPTALVNSKHAGHGGVVHRNRLQEKGILIHPWKDFNFSRTRVGGQGVW
jgi:hypothetical protein